MRTRNWFRRTNPVRRNTPKTPVVVVVHVYRSRPPPGIVTRTVTDDIPAESRDRRRPLTLYAMSSANPKIPIAVQQTHNFAGAEAEALLAAKVLLMLETLGDKERKVQLPAENAIIAFRDMLGDSASMEETAAAANECMKVLRHPARQLSVQEQPHIRHRLA